MFDLTSVYQARSVADALEALARCPEAQVIAGGTDVLVQVREGRRAGARLVSIHGLREELAGVRADPSGDLCIGPLTTFREVTEHPLIRDQVPVLGEAADQVGGPQIRAMGTIGGNLCNGVTSADTASTLVALEAELTLTGGRGGRTLPISRWYLGAGRVALEPGELLTGIRIPRDSFAGVGGCYIKYAQRSAMDIATLGVSCLVRLTPDRTRVDRLRLAFGVAGPVPVRALEAEELARGLTVDEAAARVGRAALAELQPRDSWRASRAFREQLIAELSGRALRQAAERGGAEHA